MWPKIYTIASQSLPSLILIFLAWKEFRSGSSKLSDKIKSDYKERNDQLEKTNKELEAERTERKIYITKLETTIAEKDKQLDRYEKIFANRNPDLTEVLEKISRFMAAIHNQNKHQTTILEKRQKRDKLIDEASLNHKGSPMMAPTDPSIKS